MPLLYTVVANKNVVLANHATTIGNFAEVTEQVLCRIDVTKNKKMTYEKDSYKYHYLYTRTGLTFLCITDEEFKQSSAFAYLDSVVEEFEKLFSSRSNFSEPMSLNGRLHPILKAKMKDFNLIEDQNKLMPAGAEASGSEDNKIQKARNVLNETKDKMAETIDAVLERGERLAILDERADNLAQNAVTFKQASRTVRRQMWWQNWKLKIGVGIGILIAIYVIVSISCGGLAWQSCVN